MIKKSFILISSIFFSLCSFAQVGINTTTPDPSAILDITSTNKGVLFPRVALNSATDVVTVENPAKGLMVYNTGTGNLTTEGYLVWNGSEWVQFTTGTSKSPEIQTLDCVNARIQPTRYKAGEPYEGILIVPYIGGNGGYYGSGEPVISTGVTGLTAKLQSGNLAYGNGDLVYTLTGTPSASSPELASFEITFLGQTCTATVGANSLQQGEQTYWRGTMPANVGGTVDGKETLASDYISDLPLIEDALRMDAYFRSTAVTSYNTVSYDPRIYNISNDSIKIWASEMSSQEGFGFSNIILKPGAYLQFDNGVYLNTGQSGNYYPGRTPAYDAIMYNYTNNGQETVTIDLFYKSRWYRLYYVIFVDDKNLRYGDANANETMTRELYLSVQRLY